MTILPQQVQRRFYVLFKNVEISLQMGRKFARKCGFSLEEEEKLVETVSHAQSNISRQDREYIPSKYEYYVTP